MVLTRSRVWASRRSVADVDDETAKLAEDVKQSVGWMHDFERTLAEEDPEFFRALAGLLKVVYARQSAIPIKYKMLISIALGAARQAPGIKAHVEKALGHGATRTEIVEAIEMASTKFGNAALAHGAKGLDTNVG